MAAFFREHRRLVEGLCRSLLRDPVQAEDASQQTFLAAYQAILRAGRPREPAAWLAAIARNECRARLRAGMREPLPDEGAEPLSFASDPAVITGDRDALRELISELRDLPESQRRALLLRQIGGLSYDELSARLAVSVPAVEALLFRARARLRERLAAAQAAVAGSGWLTAVQDAFARLISSGGAAKLGVPLGAKAVTVVATLGALASAGVVAERQHDRPSTWSPAPQSRSVVLAPASSPSPVAISQPSSPAAPDKLVHPSSVRPAGAVPVATAAPPAGSESATVPPASGPSAAPAPPAPTASGSSDDGSGGGAPSSSGGDSGSSGSTAGGDTSGSGSDGGGSSSSGDGSGDSSSGSSGDGSSGSSSEGGSSGDGSSGSGSGSGDSSGPSGSSGSGHGGSGSDGSGSDGSGSGHSGSGSGASSSGGGSGSRH